MIADNRVIMASYYRWKIEETMRLFEIAIDNHSTFLSLKRHGQTSKFYR